MSLRHCESGGTGARTFGDLAAVPHGREGRFDRYLELCGKKRL